MKILNNHMLDVIEASGEPKASWIIIEDKYGKNKLTERISFYEIKGNLFSIVDRSSKTRIYQYENREEGNLHFNQMKLTVACVGGYFLKDKRSG